MSIWMVVDKSQATEVKEQLFLPPTPLLKIKKRPEEIEQEIIYRVINKVRHLLWLPTILPSTPYYRK
ncbi:MAG: hypothetical protein ACD_49C00067G0052 [uncultured bacterium (gcode 4)]|uniref:Uncharacterized protein n=1 Tax=uncultured bacterium (gcode 4) TaxID=1234023 RepID=K2AWJ2_9BACT|nr:MAG: hypothetical protein ACD_49C00067G0052 [uncultured bacterium (gcode 4)]